MRSVYGHVRMVGVAANCHSSGRGFAVMTRVCVLLLAFVAGSMNVVEGRQVSPVANDGFRIVVIQGEDAVNVIQQKTATAAIIEVRDKNNLPVSGAVVTFSVTGGNSALFAGGSQTLTVTTNAVGRAAAAALNPLTSGPIQIQVTAAVQGQVVTAATIAQTNVMTLAEAAATGTAGASSGGGAAAGGGGGISGPTLGIVGGAVAAGGAALALTGGDERTPTTAVTVDPVRVDLSAAPTLGLQAATPIRFSASASGTTLSYAWDFGDGTTRAAEPAASATHTYPNAGTFTAKVTVTDGRTTATAETRFEVRSVTGRWSGNFRCEAGRPQCAGANLGDYPLDFSVVQSGTTVSGSYNIRYPNNAVYTCSISGRVMAPNIAVFADIHGCPAIGQGYSAYWGGALDASLNRLDARLDTGPYFLIRQ